jgi:hypothetical protein
MSERDCEYVAFIAAEGPSEIGELSAQAQWRSDPPREGYFQPMLRKLLGGRVAFDGQKITLLGRFDAKKKLEGHADRAAKALVLASTVEGCRVLVFAHDVDKGSGEKRNATERRRRVKAMHEEIDAGFATVKGADHVLRVKATPLRMIEAWALGDPDAVAGIAEKGSDSSALPKSPEETWGDESDPGSGHPKSLLRRALGCRPSAAHFAELAAHAEVGTLRASCPESFARFADEAESAGRDAVVAEMSPPPPAPPRR